MIKTHQLILDNISKTTQANYKIIGRFSGGMSNFTYEVEDEKTKKKYVFRIPGVGAENFVDYQVEEKVLEAVKELGLNSTNVYLDASLGIKLAEFIPGSNLVGKNIDLTRIVKKLKFLHESDIQFENDYGHFERLTKYEGICKEPKTPQYQALKAEFQKLYEQALKKHIHYPCHCDAQLANFILADEYEINSTAWKPYNPSEDMEAEPYSVPKIYLLDWEFAGMNDYIYDLASFGNLDFQAALDLLRVYHPNPSADLFVRLYGWRMFQCLQWHNVAEYKHEIGLGEQLNIPFDKVASKYLNLAAEMFENLKQYQ